MNVDMPAGPAGPPERWDREHTMLWGTSRLPRSHDRGNGAIIGGVGSGKTTLLLTHMLSILGYLPDRLETVNAWVFDPKNQLYRTLLSWDLGLKVILTNVMDRRAWSWAMWRDLRDPVSADQFAHDVIPDEKDSSSNKYFTDAARAALAAVLRELIRFGRPWTLRQACLLAMSVGHARRLFERSPDPVVLRTLDLLDPDQGTTLPNLKASLLTKLKDVAAYAALMEHAPAEFSIDQLIRSDVVVVLGSDFRFSHVLGPMNALMMNVLKQRLLSQGDVTDDSRRHYLFIDEFPKLNYNAPAEDFPDFCELGRSKGVRVCIVLQTTEQVKKLYGSEGLGYILGQCQNKIILRVSDVAGATECSNMLPFFRGYERLASDSVSSGPNGLQWTSGSSETRADRPLVPPDVIQHLPLADWDLGWRGFALGSSMRRVPAWQFHVTPRFLAEHLGADRARELIACERDDLLLPYEACTRPAHEQYLEELTPYELRSWGLDPDTDDGTTTP